MKTFKSFGIHIKHQSFIGNKIKIKRILDREIIVHAHKIETSKQFKGQCLHLQIEVDGEKHVIFTGSVILSEQIKQVPAESFPFTARIVEENERYMFQ